MLARIERGTNRIDPLHSGIFQLLGKLPVHGAETGSKRGQRRGGVTSDQPVHVVEHVEELGHEARLGSIAQFGPLTVDPLPVIIEFGGQPEVPVLELGDLVCQVSFTTTPKRRLGSFSARRGLGAHVGGCKVGSIRISVHGHLVWVWLSIEISSKIGSLSHLKTLTSIGLEKDNSNTCAGMECQSGRKRTQF